MFVGTALGASELSEANTRGSGVRAFVLFLGSGGVLGNPEGATVTEFVGRLVRSRLGLLVVVVVVVVVVVFVGKIVGEVVGAVVGAVEGKRVGFSGLLCEVRHI